MEDGRQLEQRVRRLEHLLRLHRLGLVLAATVVLVLVGLLLLGRSPQTGRAILVNDAVVAMVRNEQAAAEVRRRLLAAGSAGCSGAATFREKWEDATRPAEGARVLSVGEAVAVVRPKVTVVVEAFAIEANGARLLVVPTLETAQSILNKLKVRYASEADAVVRETRLQPTPTIRPVTVPPEQIVTDIMVGVERLATARATPAWYTVRPGDFPERIAERHDMTVAELYRLNPGLQGQTLRVGQRLQVLGPGTGLAVVTVKETVSTEPVMPAVVREATTALPPGSLKTVDPGKPGRKRVRWEVVTRNRREISRRALSEEIIAPAQPKHVLVGTR